jgi:sugar phosphate isomerase/epimerase
MELRLPLAAITDEFTPELDTAAQAMLGPGIRQAELRVLWGRNILDLSDADLARAKAILDSRGLKAVSIASPLLKCILPDSPPVDSRFEHDVFASAHTYEDQPQLLRRACQIAHTMEASVIRVFSFWRTVDPARCFDRIAEALTGFARQAAQEDVILGLENEHACNAATGAETAALLQAVRHPNLKAVWDPANAYVAGEHAFPGGYRVFEPGDIVHVHAKDCLLDGGKPQWVPLGTGALDWKAQFRALCADGYQGSVSLETHWPGPAGDKLQASIICGWNLRGLLTW